MNTVLWIAQGLLAVLFLMGGLMKATQPKEKLTEKMPFVNDYADGTVRLIGLSQLLAAIGLLLPMITGIAPVLTPVAASGLALTMVLAATYHLKKKEFKSLPINGVLFLLAAFVALGRFGLLGG